MLPGVNRREIPRLRVPALRAKPKARDTPLGMTARGDAHVAPASSRRFYRCGERKANSPPRWRRYKSCGANGWHRDNHARPFARGIWMTFTPSMFAGHGMPCPYEETATAEARDEANAGRKASGLPGRRRRERLSYIFVRAASEWRAHGQACAPGICCGALWSTSPARVGGALGFCDLRGAG